VVRYFSVTAGCAALDWFALVGRLPKTMAELGRLTQILQQQNWKEAKEHCEEIELQAFMQTPPTLSEEFYTISLLVCLLEKDLISARFLLKRMPNQIKDTSNDIQLLSSIVKALWNRNWSSAHALLASVEWKENTKDLVCQLSDHLRESTLVLVSKSYTCIRLKDLADFLGVADVEASAISQSKGWAVDNSMVFPKLIEQEVACHADLDLLKEHTRHVMFLEKDG